MPTIKTRDAFGREVHLKLESGTGVKSDPLTLAIRNDSAPNSVFAYRESDGDVKYLAGKGLGTEADPMVIVGQGTPPLGEFSVNDGTRLFTTNTVVETTIATLTVPAARLSFPKLLVAFWDGTILQNGAPASTVTFRVHGLASSWEVLVTPVLSPGTYHFRLLFMGLCYNNFQCYATLQLICSNDASAGIVTNIMGGGTIDVNLQAGFNITTTVQLSVAHGLFSVETFGGVLFAP